MIKKFLIILSIFLLNILSVQAEPNLRSYDGIEIPQGTLLQVISLQEFSTLATDYKTPLWFVACNDTYLFETNVIPNGTKFLGYIEKKNEPILGTNGSMVVRIVKIKFQDGYEIPIKAYIYSNNNCMIGGELTAPEKYDTIPHYHKGIARHYLGVLRYVPGAVRKMGEHTTVASGAELLILFTNNAYITHSVYN